MGTTILLLAFLFEVAFAAYCMITRSNQEKVRGYIRAGAFAAFVLFTLVSVVEWSFRWYLLALLLFVWAVLGTWILVRRKEKKKEYKSWRIVGKSIAMFLLVFLALIPALIFPQHRMPKVTGTHAIATAAYTYVDKSRIETFTNTGENREVNVECWYPKDGDGKYPLVVFSHGTGGVKTSNTSTFMELASNGYVACSIDHPYHSLFTVDASGRRTMINQPYLQEYMNLNGGQYSEAEKFQIQKKWMDLRTADINFVLDTLLAATKDEDTDPVYKKIDAEKIGLIGHSLGGESVALVARQRNDIDAVVNLDADLQGEYLDYVDGRYVINDTVYPVPLLTIYSDDLARLIAAIPDADKTIAVKHVSATDPNAYEVHIAGSNHMGLTDLPLNSPFLASLISSSVKHVGGETADTLAVIEEMNDTVLSFFNVYLKGEGTFTPPATD